MAIFPLGFPHLAQTLASARRGGRAGAHAIRQGGRPREGAWVRGLLSTTTIPAPDPART